MNTKSTGGKRSAEHVVKDIRRATRRHFSSEDTIRIVLDGLRGEDSIAELCRKEGIAQGLYYTWSKEFLEAGKRRLAGDTARAATTGEAQDLRRENRALKEAVADLTLENRLLKKHDRGWGRRRMGYPASEKLEIIRIVEQSHLPAKKALDQFGIARRTFYRWYDRYVEGGPEALEDRPSRPSRVWNRICAEVQSQIIDMALEQSELSPRELAVRFTDEKRYFVSEATVYRLLKAHDLITSPAFVVIKAAEEFKDKTTRPNEMWQTDFTYFKIIGWGWVYLPTVLDDFSRYILAWKLCTTMRAEDVTDTLELALTASGCDSARMLHKPKLLSDNGPSYIAAELAEWIDANGMSHVRSAPLHPQTQGKIERWHQALKNRILLENYFLPGDLERQIEAFIEHYNHQRYHESLGNVTPADVYFGRAADIIEQRERIKRKTIQLRRLQHRKLAAQHQSKIEADTPLNQTAISAKCSDDGHVALIRSLPLILVLFWFFFLVPIVLGAIIHRGQPVPIGGIWTAFITFSLFEAAYYSEIIRVGFRSVGLGRYEAAKALSLSTYKTYRLVILPQVLQVVSPIILNQTIILFQDTSLVYVLSLTDLVGAASKLAQLNGRLVETYMTVAVIYLVICSLTSQLVNFLRQRTQIQTSR